MNKKISILIKTFVGIFLSGTFLKGAARAK